jgi:hypothetical protein
VLAAVLVLGVLYTVLAQVAIDGLRSEGASRRRLEASVLADSALAAFEEQVRLGAVPAPGAGNPEERDPFTLQVDVRELDVEALLPPRPPGEEGPDVSLLAAAGGQPSPLREIVVRVAWNEGDRGLEVTRSTYAFDASGFAELFPAAGGDGGAGGGDGATGGDGSGEDGSGDAVLGGGPLGGGQQAPSSRPPSSPPTSDFGAGGPGGRRPH